MLHILILCEYTSLHGGERSMLATLPGLLSQGFRITIVCPPQGALVEQVKYLGIESTPFSLIGPDGKRKSQTVLRSQLQKIIEEIAPDVVHANSVSMSRLSGPVLGCTGRLGIGHLRDQIKLSATALHDMARHHRLLAVSQSTKSWFTNAGIPLDKIRVTHNGVDLQRFTPRSATGYLHRELNLPSCARLLCAIGQIGMRKGLDVTLASMRQVFSRLSDVHLLLIGERYSTKQEARIFEARLHDCARVEPLQNRVHFLGYRDDISRILGEVSLLVHAARREPLGRVLLEAAAAGVATVATDVGGTAEIFTQLSGSAFLIPVDDAGMMATSVEKLLASEKLQRSVQQAARQRAVEAFDIKHATTRLSEHYLAVSKMTAGP